MPDFLLAKVQKSLLMKQQPQNEQQAIPGHCFLSTRMAMDGARSGIGVLESAGEKLRGGAWSIRGCLVVNEQVFFFSLNFKPAQAGICFVKVRDPLKQSAKIEP